MVVIEAGVLGLSVPSWGRSSGSSSVPCWWPGRVPALDWCSIHRGFSIGLAVLFGFLISVAASIYPAGLASRTSIVRALQHE